MTYYEKQGITAAEYDRILKSLDQQNEQVRDLYGVRWVKCETCGRAVTAYDSWKYGGIDTMNIGECYECKLKNLKGNLKI